MAVPPRLSERERFLLTVENDTEDAPWMVMSSLQVRDVDLLKSILLLHAQQQELPWVIDSYLKLVIPRPDERPLEAAPDLLVAIGVEERLRTSWLVNAEGKAPEFALEVASLDSWGHDSTRKPGIYDAMGVGEYVLFFPRQGGRGPRLLGYRRNAAGGFVRWEPDEEEVLWCRSLGLGLVVEGGLWLRALDAQGRRLPSPAELAVRESQARREEARARAAAEQRAQEEAQARVAESVARLAAEEELRRLREQLRRRDEPTER